MGEGFDGVGKGAGVDYYFVEGVAFVSTGAETNFRHGPEGVTNKPSVFDYTSIFF